MRRMVVLGEYSVTISVQNEQSFNRVKRQIRLRGIGDVAVS